MVVEGRSQSELIEKELVTPVNSHTWSVGRSKNIHKEIEHMQINFSKAPAYCFHPRTFLLWGNSGTPNEVLKIQVSEEHTVSLYRMVIYWIQMQFQKYDFYI